MKRVIIESPYAPNQYRGCTYSTPFNVRYAQRCLLDSLSRGEAPFASHLLYTQVWDDTIPDLRARGIAAGLAWGPVTEARIFYLDYGWTPGMLQARAACSLPHEERYIVPV